METLALLHLPYLGVVTLYQMKMFAPVPSKYKAQNVMIDQLMAYYNFNRGFSPN